MPEDRKWVLLAEYSDKTMLRNKLTYEMGAMSSLDYTPTGEYIELFLNNTHQGTYLLAQKVEESSNRVQIGDDGYLIPMFLTSRRQILVMVLQSLNL
jgi:spore coat protein CotH